MSWGQYIDISTDKYITRDELDWIWYTDEQYVQNPVSNLCLVKHTVSSRRKKTDYIQVTSPLGLIVNFIILCNRVSSFYINHCT